MPSKSKPPAKPKKKAQDGRKAAKAPRTKACTKAPVSVSEAVPEVVKGKHPGGRPTTYRPEYCEMVMEWGRQGKSRTWIAAELNTTRETLDDWTKRNPEFSDALTRAKIYEQQWWEDAGQSGMISDKFNNGVWAKNMACRFSSEWRDNKALEVSGKDGGPIEIGIVDILGALDGSTRTAPVSE